MLDLDQLAADPGRDHAADVGHAEDLGHRWAEGADPLVDRAVAAHHDRRADVLGRRGQHLGQAQIVEVLEAVVPHPQGPRAAGAQRHRQHPILAPGRADRDRDRVGAPRLGEGQAEPEGAAFTRPEDLLLVVLAGARQGAPHEDRDRHGATSRAARSAGT
jgi:hypothetical protein